MRLGVVHKLRLQEVVQKSWFFVNVYKVEDVNGGENDIILETYKKYW